MLISSPHKVAGAAVPTVMFEVVLGLVPGLITYACLLGWGLLVQCLIATATALACEAAALKLRGRAVKPGISDGSAVVLALILAAAVAPQAPWWTTAAGTAFAVLLAKHAFGGLGANIFNPAMAGYVFLLLCFPAEINRWSTMPDVGGSLAGTLRLIFMHDVSIDAVSGATPLNQIKSELRLMHMLSEMDAEGTFGLLGAARWEWVNLAFLAGGIWLLIRKTIPWQLPAAVLTGLFAGSSIMFALDSDTHVSPLFSLFSGASMIGAFFVATEPVSSPTTAMGRWIYGLSIGVLTCSIRVSGIYPDGLAFSVLLMNAFTPMLDRVSRPRVLGHR